MIKTILSLHLTLSLILFNATLSAQSPYEILYINGELETIIEQAQNKQTVNDYFWYAVVHNKKGENQKAVEVTEEGLSRFKNNDQLGLLISGLYYESGNYVKAKPYLEKYQGNPETFIQLINVLEFQNKYYEAIDLLKTRINDYSAKPVYYAHLGDNYLKIDSVDQAIKNYEKVFSVNNEDQVTGHKLANLYIRIKRYKRALSVCDIVLNNDSLNIKFIKLRGATCFKQSDYKCSMEYYSRAYALGDSTNPVLKYMGISEFHQGCFISSRKHLHQAYENDTTDYEVCFYLGKGYLNSNYPEKGLYFLDRVEYLLQPDSVTMSALYMERQSLYSALDDIDKALLCYKKAYAYHSRPEYLFFIASMYQHEFNLPEEALEYYNLFIDQLPPKPESENIEEENQITISMRQVAEKNIVKLREDLFFEGRLKE